MGAVSALSMVSARPRLHAEDPMIENNKWLASLVQPAGPCGKARVGN